MKNLVVLFPLFFFLLPALAWASPPVPYSGKVAINGVNYHGQAKFVFAIRDHSGTVHWRNGATANDAINVNVANGRYVVLLGGQGMNPLPASLFANHDELYIKVSFDRGDGQGLVHLGPDLRITAVPYAKVAQSVTAGSIRGSHLGEQVLKYLKPEITIEPQAPRLIFPGKTIILKTQAEGKYLKYQWHKDGQPIVGATESSLEINNANNSDHEGNYSVSVANDFGTVSSGQIDLNVNTPQYHEIGSIGMKMIFCPPGTFSMGNPQLYEAIGQVNETQHLVTLDSGFYLGQHEVTQDEYEKVMNGYIGDSNATPSKFSGHPNRPVERVSWNDVQVFLSRLNQMEGQAGQLRHGWRYVLPTEAEWEYACRAGTTGPWAFADMNTSLSNIDFNQTQEVGSYPPNPWGFMDMHGNVFEWCADWYDVYPTGSVSNPIGPSKSLLGDEKVLRGGAFDSNILQTRSASRTARGPGERQRWAGFRIAYKPVPEINLMNSNHILVAKGTKWKDPGFDANDSYDGNLTHLVSVDGFLDTNKTGFYELFYTVENSVGNKARVSRKIIVGIAQTISKGVTPDGQLAPSNPVKTIDISPFSDFEILGGAINNNLCSSFLNNSENKKPFSYTPSHSSYKLLSLRKESGTVSQIRIEESGFLDLSGSCFCYGTARSLGKFGTISLEIIKFNPISNSQTRFSPYQP